MRLSDAEEKIPMSVYDTDILVWSERPAALLRRIMLGELVNDQVDWENVCWRH